MVNLLAPLLLLKSATALGALDPGLLGATQADADGTVAGPDAIMIAPSKATYIEVRYQDTVIRGRPWVPHKRIATLGKGTRLVVRGEVESRDKEGCKGKPWYAVWPMGYVCSRHAVVSDEPPELGAALPLSPGKRLPHAYALVRSNDTPAYGSEDDARLGVESRTLTKGMSLVITRSVELDGVRYVGTKDGLLVAKEDVGWMGQGSQWQGVRIEDAAVGPLFAWSRKEKVKAWPQPQIEGKSAGGEKDPPIASLALRDRVRVLESRGTWRRIVLPEARVPEDFDATTEVWVEQSDLNEVVIIDPPEGTLTDFRQAQTGNDQWVDVDVGEQVLVAYRDDDPVYATLISSGRGSPTPLGNYPIWAKVASMDMGNQDYEDNPYLVQGVPWVLLFQGHIALHGAYWHNRFGNRKSHGCVNLAPQDARWVFEWMGPTLPFGWTGFLPDDLHKSPVVHVRDSSKPDGETFTQQRPWGPPDRDAERRKSEAAAERRAMAAAVEPEAPAAGGLPTPGTPAPRIESKPLPSPL